MSSTLQTRFRAATSSKLSGVPFLILLKIPIGFKSDSDPRPQLETVSCRRSSDDPSPEAFSRLRSGYNWVSERVYPAEFRSSNSSSLACHEGLCITVRSKCATGYGCVTSIDSVDIVKKVHLSNIRAGLPASHLDRNLLKLNLFPDLKLSEWLMQMQSVRIALDFDQGGDMFRAINFNAS
ncbi:hypothetical protein R3P38DRAFT_3266928 [Favolaschia claudopus]|uniref:Uncharacterized protein n=1 Tax=Favolaschia claudopus TaxID=2862362 RepID=A0AAW0BUQ5_9AGAR